MRFSFKTYFSPKASFLDFGLFPFIYGNMDQWRYFNKFQTFRDFGIRGLRYSGIVWIILNV